MDLTNLSSVYSQYADTVSKNSETEAFQQRIKQSASASDEELMEVCKQFEAYFMEQVYKEMLKTIPQSDDKTGNQTMIDYFKDQTVSEIAMQSVNQNGQNGLAQTLFEQMRRNYDQ